MTTGAPGNPGRELSAKSDLQVAFDAACAVAGAENPGPQLLPVRLAAACASVLHVDGAGISIFEKEFRVPLGASDDTASLAERLQFTHGQGPCLDAAREGRSSVSDLQAMSDRWPQFADELIRRTPFRGVASLPLSVADSTKGALDLFLVDEADLRDLRLGEAIEVGAAVVAALNSADPLPPPQDVDDEPEAALPAWVMGPSADGRRFVWLAVGMTMVLLDISADDALARLRSYAYGHDAELDDVALALIEGRLDGERLRL